MELTTVHCNRCGIPMENALTAFFYLDHVFHEEIPRCPSCKQAFVPEELARGRMREVELQLEDK